MIIRAKTFKDWLKHNFCKSNLEDIATHGANCGWHGLIYTQDITKLYEKFKQELWEHLMGESESCGYTNPFEFLATFNGAKDVSDADSFETLLVYFAAESMASQLAGIR